MSDIREDRIEEALLFQEEAKRQCGYFYQYMHGERTEPNEAVTIFKRSIEFFDADWIGLIDFDLEVGAWSTRCFYNKRTGSSTETLIEDAESAAQAKRWVEAIRGGRPILGYSRRSLCKCVIPYYRRDGKGLQLKFIRILKIPS